MQVKEFVVKLCFVARCLESCSEVRQHRSLFWILIAKWTHLKRTATLSVELLLHTRGIPQLDSIGETTPLAPAGKYWHILEQSARSASNLRKWQRTNSENTSSHFCFLKTTKTDCISKFPNTSFVIIHFQSTIYNKCSWYSGVKTPRHW
jgi:hypothetical protein